VRKMILLIMKLDATNNVDQDRLTLTGKDICHLTCFNINYKVTDICLLTTNKIYIPVKCKYLLFYILYSPTHYGSN
jgi:hypothetical protein